jgi:hypothetical protein
MISKPYFEEIITLLKFSLKLGIATLQLSSEGTISTIIPGLNLLSD